MRFVPLARSSRPSRRPRRGLLALGLALAVGLVAAVAVERADRPGGVPAVRDAADGDAADGDVARPAEEAADERAGGDEGDQGLRVARLGATDAADPDRRLIRRGAVTVGHAETFDAAYRQVAALAGRLGGGVLDVDSRTDDDGVTRGAVTVEVPVGDYDELLSEVGEVGEVRRRDVRTEDVTDAYTDLASRLRHLERTEEFFLELFDDAETVDDAVTLRDRLDSVQERIEEIEGRLARLDERTRMSRLTVELVPADDELDHGPTVTAGFADYWGDARGAFVSVAGTMLVLAVGGAPLLVPGVGALLVVVLLARTWRAARAGAAAPANAGPPE